MGPRDDNVCENCHLERSMETLFAMVIKHFRKVG